jgi:hypothetical protein
MSSYEGAFWCVETGGGAQFPSSFHAPVENTASFNRSLDFGVKKNVIFLYSTQTQ